MSNLSPDERWEAVELLQKEYKRFPDFLYDVITGLMGFECSPLQLDIALYLEFGPTYRMIQAQRGQAKTTITAVYAVWRLIHDPAARILIVSSGDTMATEIANWIIQIIRGMDVLECLRPDKTAGDRESVTAYDIHNALKGPEKSPSVACMGIGSNMQGKRADVLIADDIESSKNSQTAIQRERLAHLSKDFSSICSNGDIIYLGTPQSIDSIYNGLVSRGFEIRVWPGRFPTAKEIENYGEHLAPTIMKQLKDNPKLQTGGGLLGDKGQPTDPVLLDEETLVKKELDQGSAYFQLQHMLDTRLSDEERFPLKAGKLIFMDVPSKRVPLTINKINSPEFRVLTPPDFAANEKYYRAASFGDEFGGFIGTYMYVDPAGGGQNGDETGYAVTKCAGDKVFVLEVGAVKGGFEPEVLQQLTAVAVRWKPDKVAVEKNMGNGAFWSIWQPYLLREHKCAIEEVWETGQKELRIIDVLEPVMGAGRLVMDTATLKQDHEISKMHPVAVRKVYSLFYQMSRITRDRGSLIHDDRLDALAGAVRYWIGMLKLDEEILKKKAKEKAYQEMIKDPLGTGQPIKTHGTQRTSLNRLNKRKQYR